MSIVLFLVLKGRNDVAMGVSPWSACQHVQKVPKGRNELPKYPNTTINHVVRSGLRQWLPTSPWAFAHG